MKVISTLMVACVALAAAGAKHEECAQPVSQNVRGHEDTEWSIAYGYGYVREANLPRVLLIGDSITYQYEGGVKGLLKGKATLSFWASSYCLTHPAYMRLLDFYLGEADYSVIHFNNGLHSLSTPTEAWTASFREALLRIRKACPGAKIVWTPSTPLKDPKLTDKVRELNAAAAKVIAEFGDIAVDDLFATMDSLDRAAFWSDTYHFKPEAKKIQSEQVAKACLKAAGLLAPEPGKALLDAKWADGWTRTWTVSNLNDIVTLTAKDGVLRMENAGAPGTKGSSYFTIRSELVKVAPGDEFVVLMESRGNLDMLMPVTTFRAKENQLRAFVPATAVLWYKEDGTPLLALDACGAMLPTGSSFGFKAMGDSFARMLHFGTVPKDAAYAAVQVGGKYPSFKPGQWLELRRLALKVRTGADWDFGDIAAPKLERVSPSPDPNPSAPFVFTVTDESPIAQLAVKLDGVDVTGKMKAEGEGERRMFTVSHAPWADESLHLLEVSAKDAAGNIARETLAQYCGPRRKGKQISVRDDGMILVGGKPFFPIGTSGARLAPPNGNDPERLFAEFASNGLNCVQGSYAYRTPAECYHDGGKGHQGPRPIAEMEAFHAAARRHGILLRTEPASRDYGTAKRTKEFVEALRYYRDKPEMVFYEVSDDTASHVTPDILRNDYNICRAIDNLALVTQSDANDYAGRYAPYAPATDVFLQELYPFRNAEHEPNGLAQIIRDCDFAFDGLRVSGMRNRSIWSIPQAFAGWGLWKKYPSRELVRVQTYLAIICGCRGISYYTYWSYSPGADGWGHDPKHTEELYSVTRELSSIAEDLTSRDAKVQPKVEIVAGTAKDPGGYSSVSCLLKDGADGKGPLLIAASSLVYGDPVTVRIPLEADKVETLFENGRKVDFRSGVLTDTFAPGEVHVYRLAK